ncbi:4F5 domain protein [Drechmeria coniospora]|uniref:4F5 domain protein n=1 Tax=Drechmeria coniospora TaxID=98403 RepID=A0A151GMS2_DRECN|nr:4F5 domain protein [Drechmeria coniospora]KYK58409.1 4F5 domain protein [Drechmeria coniospora]
MARGNQRDKAREANQKKMAAQKKGNSMSGTEMQRAKESAADIMRQKQAAGTPTLPAVPPLLVPAVRMLTGFSRSRGQEGRGGQEIISVTLRWIPLRCKSNHRGDDGTEYDPIYSCYGGLESWIFRSDEPRHCLLVGSAAYHRRMNMFSSCRSIVAYPEQP